MHRWQRLRVVTRRFVDDVAAQVARGLRAIPGLRRILHLPHRQIGALGPWMAKGKGAPGGPGWGEGQRYDVVHPPVFVVRPAPASPLGEPIPRPLAMEDVHAHPEVFLARLPGARLLGPHGTVLTADGHVVQEAAWDGRLDRDRALRALRLPPATHVGGEYYTVASVYAYGYAHWVLEVLPRLIAFERFAARQPQLVVGQPLVAWQAESLELLGFGTVPRLVLGHRYVSVDVLHLPSYVGRPGHPHPWGCEWLRARLVSAPRPTARHRRLYVTRRRALRRRVVNEDQLAPILRDFGFEIVECETLSFREQVELFRDAEAVAGPHGAGLTNLMWAPDGCRVLELFGDRCVRSLFYVLAALRAQPYAFIVGASEGSIGIHGDDGVYDLRVSPEDFARGLTFLLSTEANSERSSSLV